MRSAARSPASFPVTVVQFRSVISLSPCLPRVPFKAVSSPPRVPAASAWRGGPFSMSFAHVPHARRSFRPSPSPFSCRGVGIKGAVCGSGVEEERALARDCCKSPNLYAVHVRTLGVWQTTRCDLSHTLVPIYPLSPPSIRPYNPNKPHFSLPLRDCRP